MHVQVNIGTQIEGREALATRVRGAVESALGRVSDHITRVEVHLSDENGRKRGQDDKHCVMEARLEGRQPVAVTHEAATFEQAIDGAERREREHQQALIEVKLGDVGRTGVALHTRSAIVVGIDQRQERARNEGGVGIPAEIGARADGLESQFHTGQALDGGKPQRQRTLPRDNLYNCAVARSFSISSSLCEECL